MKQAFFFLLAVLVLTLAGSYFLNQSRSSEKRESSAADGQGGVLDGSGKSKGTLTVKTAGKTAAEAIGSEKPAVSSETKVEANVVGSKEAAEAWAREKLRGKLNVPDDCPTIVVEKNGKYEVTFLCVTAADTLGADYHAKVTLDAKTGAVLEILAGS
jgi:hypothetical protein